MKTNTTKSLKRRGLAAFTLEEVLTSLSIVGITFAGVTTGYVNSARQVQWSARMQAAQNVVMQQADLVRAAKWDQMGNPPVDELQATNFPLTGVMLDLPVAGQMTTWATNRTTISTVPGPVPAKLVTVECVWPLPSGLLQTNQITVYRTPDQ